MSSNALSQFVRNPLIVLVIVILSTVATFSVSVRALKQSYAEQSVDQERRIQAQRIRSRLLYLQQKSVRIARMIVLTGSSDWEEFYQHNEQKFQNWIEIAAEFRSELSDGILKQRQSSLKQKLSALEAEAFRLVRNNQSEEARELLYGREYQNALVKHTKLLERSIELEEPLLRLVELREEIVTLNDLITMAARSASITGELKWKEQYEHLSLEAEVVQQEARLLVPHVFNSLTAQKRDVFRQRMGELETDLFAQLERGELEEAKSFLTNSEYNRIYSEYRAASEVVNHKLEKHLQTLREEQKEQLFGRVNAFYLLFPVMVLSWVYVLWTLFQWKRESRRFQEKLLRTNRELAESQKTLEETAEQANQMAQVAQLSKRELEVLCRNAEQANSAKSSFLASMSHEIRTPMTAIVGYAEYLLEHVEGEENRQAVETICRNSGYLLQLINDILDLSKIESEKMSIELLEFSPVDVLHEVMSLMRLRAENKGLDFVLDHEGIGSELLLRSDPTKIRQILFNLVENAIKFTESGEVRVVARLIRPVGQQGLSTFQIEVVDTGIGIAEEQQSKLFTTFSQVEPTIARQYGGTGLGLAISKKLARLMNGELTVSSRPGVGSCFTMTVSAQVVASVRRLSEEGQSGSLQPVAAESVSLNSKRILLAEDAVDNQRLLKFLLNKAGAEVVIAKNGEVAVEIVESSEVAGEPFDLILMDLAMPVMDGYAATRQLRQQGCRVPIVALTAHAMSEHRERCLEVGCDDYLSKPVKQPVLLEMVHRYTTVRDSEVSHR